MIEDIDGNTIQQVGDDYAILSKVFGLISYDKISGGVKTLILLLKDDSEFIFNISACGDNCAKWIQHISTLKDITVRLGYLMEFDFSDGFYFKVDKEETYIKSKLEFIDVAQRTISYVGHLENR